MAHSVHAQMILFDAPVGCNFLYLHNLFSLHFDKLRNKSNVYFTSAQIKTQCQRFSHHVHENNVHIPVHTLITFPIHNLAYQLEIKHVHIF